ncbi:MAG: hypothetical protein IT257_08985 [Chitinophagaceae bacterium]|nr:hypothetical protein [Chitinophagaceae bacterium]
MKIKLFLVLCTLSYACTTHAAAISLLDAVNQKKVLITATGNSPAANPQGGSHTGKCLKLNIKNQTGAKLDIKIESAYHFQNQHKAAQDLMVTENMLVSIAGNQTKSVALNALCTEKTNSSPSETDTFLLIRRNDAQYTNLTAIFEKYKCFLNTAQQAIWCFTDNNPINYIYDTDGDTTVENVLVAYVSTTKGVPMPARKRYIETPRIIYYPIEVDSSLSIYIDRVTTIGIYITDSAHHPIITLFADETEKRTGTAKYSFFYRGQQPKGRYYIEMKKNGEWVRVKELLVGMAAN